MHEIVTDPSEFATTPDLRLLALTNWNNDFSAIGVCDVEAGAAEVLHVERKATLGSPALSSDGRAIAFTARMLGEDAASLFLAPVGGGAVRRLGGRTTYAGPSFSADGRRILVFAGDSAYGPRQLVELDLDSGAEELVWPGAFERGFRTAYDPLGRGYFVAAYGPAKSPLEAGIWQTSDYDIKHGFPRNFHVPRDGGEARPVASAHDIGRGARFRGVTAVGEVFLQSFSPEQGFRALLVDPQGGVRTVWLERDVGIVPSGSAISSDGKRLLTSRLLSNDAGVSLGRYEITIRALGGADARRLLSSDLRANFHPLRLA